MKFSCEQERLNSALSVVIRSVSPKHSNVALEGILLEVGSFGLRLTGFNTETGVIAKIPATVEETGTLVIAAKLFADMIRKLPNEEIQISCEEYWVTVSCGASEFIIIGTDPEDYPELPDVPQHVGLDMNQGMLKSMIGNTHFAISTSDTRTIHTGSLFEVEEDKLTVVSVDGYRLALRSETIDKSYGQSEFSFVVPSAALSEVEKICNVEDDISVCLSDKHILFRTEHISLITRRLEGEFLNYKGAIPQDNPYAIHGNRRDFISAIDRVALMISEKAKAPLRCVFHNNFVEMSSKTAIGEARDVCPMEGNGNALEIGFNHKYLQEALRHAPADKVRIEFSTPVAPCVIVPEEDDNFCYMVLPVRLKTGS